VRRERATTLLLAVVGKHNLALVYGRLMARTEMARYIFPSQPP
jgi:hypothetical protein